MDMGRHGAGIIQSYRTHKIKSWVIMLQSIPLLQLPLLPTFNRTDALCTAHTAQSVKALISRNSNMSSLEKFCRQKYYVLFVFLFKRKSKC
jgi:hypothetical protein